LDGAAVRVQSRKSIDNDINAFLQCLFADVDHLAHQGGTIATLASEAVMAPSDASSGRMDSLVDDINLESLQLTHKSSPVEMPGRHRNASNHSAGSNSDIRRVQCDSGVVEVCGSWPDSIRPELEIGFSTDPIGEESGITLGGEHLLKESLAEAMLDAALGGPAALGDPEGDPATMEPRRRDVGGSDSSGCGGAGPSDSSDPPCLVPGSSGGDSSSRDATDASGEFFVACEEVLADDEPVATATDDPVAITTDEHADPIPTAEIELKEKTPEAKSMTESLDASAFLSVTKKKGKKKKK